jgi:hypothetical protein
MHFEFGTLKHLGLQMYSTLPPVIGELVSNAWDADATKVVITVPTTPVAEGDAIIVCDNGLGMADGDVRTGYMIVGKDRRRDGENTSTKNRPVMGRKGIGKFAGFGIATQIEVESCRGEEVSRFVMDYEELEKAAVAREIRFPVMQATGEVTEGTRVTLRQITKFHNRTIDIKGLRRGLARRFSIIGHQHKFEVIVNGTAIGPEERDLKRLLANDDAGKPYLWEYKNAKIAPGKPWSVTGWIGALERTTQDKDNVQRGVSLMARGKLVQDPFVFEAVVGQQFALSYLVGELQAEFVDGKEDTVATTRNTLVWDTEANAALLKWGQQQVNVIAREWAEKRAKQNEKELAKNPLYKKFVKEAQGRGDARARKVADALIRNVISKNIVQSTQEQESVIQLCMDFLEFDSFWDLMDDINKTNDTDTGKVIQLFREWEIVEAREMMRVTEGRIKTIEKLSRLISQNALEVPTLHAFLKEFPWVLDPKWTLIADEAKYSKLLRTKYPEKGVPEKDRRIDFLCVRENTQVVVVEIKRPKSVASTKELTQIESYVYFVRDIAKNTTDN